MNFKQITPRLSTIVAIRKSSILDLLLTQTKIRQQSVVKPLFRYWPKNKHPLKTQHPSESPSLFTPANLVTPAATRQTNFFVNHLATIKSAPRLSTSSFSAVRQTATSPVRQPTARPLNSWYSVKRYRWTNFPRRLFVCFFDPQRCTRCVLTLTFMSWLFVCKTWWGTSVR